MYMKVLGERIIFIRKNQRPCIQKKRRQTEIREAMAQRLVNIPVFTEKVIFREVVSLQLKLWAS
jgi:hypothetical protein